MGLSDFPVHLAKVEARLQKKINLSDAIIIISIIAAILVIAGYVVGERYFWVNRETYYEHRITDLRKNIMKSPKPANVRVEMAMAYYLKGNAAEAVKTLKDIVKKDPQNQAASLYLGLILAEQKEYRESTDLLSRYIELNQGIETRLAYLYLGQNYYATGDYKKALFHLEEAAKRDPGNPQVYFTIGQVYSKLGDKEKATSAYNKALERAPDYREARTALQSLRKENPIKP